MQFIDLKAQYEKMSLEINQNIQNVLDSGQYDGGLCSTIGKRTCSICWC